MTTRVPQGSILGSFLFSIVIGSLKIAQEDCHVLKYAHDDAISVPIYSVSLVKKHAYDAVVDISFQFRIKCWAMQSHGHTTFEGLHSVSLLKLKLCKS